MNRQFLFCGIMGAITSYVETLATVWIELFDHLRGRTGGRWSLFAMCAAARGRLDAPVRSPLSERGLRPPGVRRIGARAKAYLDTLSDTSENLTCRAPRLVPVQ